MHARSALFDLYGDHLRTRENRAPIAALVCMLTPLGITAAATRTAVSRMARQGWLEPVQIHGARGYRATDRARIRLDDAAHRIYRTRQTTWDGVWDLLVVDPIRDRTARTRIRSGLGFLGYAPLRDSTWISPFVSPEAMEVLEGTGTLRFRAQDPDPVSVAARAWNLDALSTAYRSWTASAATWLTEPEPISRDGDERAFAVRSALVHEWRKFLFTDPGLPTELLPPDWAGHGAAKFFAEHAERLLPAASRFVDTCLTDTTHQNGDLR